jgi:excisionase family DNA binding protein
VAVGALGLRTVGGRIQYAPTLRLCEKISAFFFLALFLNWSIFRSLEKLPLKPNLRPIEIAEYLDVSLTTVYELIKSGRLPSKVVGRQLRVPRELFLRWDAELPSGAEHKD